MYVSTFLTWFVYLFVWFTHTPGATQPMHPPRESQCRVNKARKLPTKDPQKQQQLSSFVLLSFSSYSIIHSNLCVCVKVNPSKVYFSSQLLTRHAPLHSPPTKVNESFCLTELLAWRSFIRLSCGPSTSKNLPTAVFDKSPHRSQPHTVPPPHAACPHKLKCRQFWAGACHKHDKVVVVFFSFCSSWCSL